ncbi:MAG: 3-methylornithyl-N6-L-lysine dehydrogenase PylD [Deltaproteobacteria bacterium]|jgi:pyrrolysine biosynthesis protein PylD|nr:3-methylornithyl-N6-L-lysine dehydrogenase PylD [Deltaproteobacteria bacterium]
MTRLTSSDISFIGGDWSSFDRQLFELTGLDLVKLAACSLDIDNEQAAFFLSGQTVAAVPDPSGDGLIEGFAESLAAIALKMGVNKALVTAPKPSGLREAAALGATIVITADDLDFTAINLQTRRVSENGTATGLGFAQALFHLSGGKIAGRKVLVVGAGPVGQAAAWRLSTLGAQPIIYDLNSAKAAMSAEKIKGAWPWTPALGQLPSDFDLIVEASTASFLWPPQTLKPGTLISAPGVPMCFKPAPHLRQWHDPLVTGTAVMLLEASLPEGFNLF